MCEECGLREHEHWVLAMDKSCVWVCAECLDEMDYFQILA
jgi:hypothetical protein